MGNKSVASWEGILGVACERARREGLESLSMRALALECGVATGTVYNYFPSKASLISEVAARFWDEVVEVAGALPSAEEAEAMQPGDLLSYCRDLIDAVAGMPGFRRRDSASGVQASGDRIRMGDAALLDRECRQAILDGIAVRIEHDPGIDVAALERVGISEAASFIWDAICFSMERGESDAETLMELLDLALYRR
ncbi:MAG: helix-turn-helix domain-containing protein [Collinsella sp.]|nr:helix-turn-helix domain-containing protein [Collinsella sp.]